MAGIPVQSDKEGIGNAYLDCLSLLLRQSGGLGGRHSHLREGAQLLRRSDSASGQRPGGAGNCTESRHYYERRWRGIMQLTVRLKKKQASREERREKKVQKSSTNEIFIFAIVYMYIAVF